MKPILSCFLLLVFSCMLYAQPPAQKLDELFTAYAGMYHFNGTALVAKGDSIILNKGYGLQDSDKKIPNLANSIYQIGSVTKQFTAAAILLLQERGALSVTDKVSKYFPQLAVADRITLHNLLTHTSGLYNYTKDSKFMRSGATKGANQEIIFALFKDKPLDFEPGTKYSYSNTGYMLLGYIIEKVSGKTYEQFIRQNILQPLQMNQTGFDFAALKSSSKATGYYTFNEALQVAVPAVVDSSVSYAAGSIYTTTADLFKWMRAIGKQKILNPSSWTLATTPNLNSYGYGLMIDSLHGQKRVGHDGAIFGFQSMTVYYPKEGYTIIFLNNVNTPHLNKIASEAAAVLFNKPYTLPTERKEITLPADSLKVFVGTYQLAPGFSIAITLNGSQLIGQATGQDAFELYPSAATRFFLKVVEAEVEFIRDQKGAVTEMILFQNGAELKGKKIQ